MDCDSGDRASLTNIFPAHESNERRLVMNKRFSGRAEPETKARASHFRK